VPLRLLFTVMLLLGCFYGLGSYGLLDNNEGMYASIARSMSHGGSFIIPHLNGVSYFEKPPLLYWLSALSMALFGDNETAARLPVSLAMAGLAVAMALFLRRQGNERAGLIAGLMLVTSPVILIIGRTVYCDMLLTATMSIALLAFYRWYVESKLGWLILCHAMIALAVLSKGFIALLLAGGVAFCFLLMENAGRRMRQTFDPRAVAVFLLIAAPWHIAATMQADQFAWFYFINEHIMRFVGAREPHDYYMGPLWYYLPRVLLYLFPWSLLAPILWRLTRYPHALAHEHAGDKTLNRFLMIWFLLVFIFFSLARAKANYYMIVAMPPLILLMALRLDAILRRPYAAKLWRWGALALVVTFIVIASVPIVLHFKAEDLAFLDAIYRSAKLADIALPLAITLASLPFFWYWRRLPEANLFLLCLPSVILLLLLIQAVRFGEENISQKQAALYLASYADQGKLGIYEDFEEISALAFYVPAPLTIIDSASSDLAFGMKQGQRPELFPTLTRWLGQHRDDNAVLLVRTHYLDALQRRLGQLPHAPSFCIQKQFAVVTILAHCSH